VQAGLREPGGSGPRLHDLRATFSVTRLLLWYRDGEPVMARLPLLSTYPGHACISDTEVYLRYHHHAPAGGEHPLPRLRRRSAPRGW
jgi:integrase